jgi:hypothetical protein
VNDVFNCCDEPLFLFADYTDSFVSSTSVDDLFVKANRVLQSIFSWCCANKLSINSAKTSFIIFKPNEQFIKLYLIQKHIITINNAVIKRCTSIKFLGVVIDEQLTFKEHNIIHDLISACKRFIKLVIGKEICCQHHVAKCYFIRLCSQNYCMV